MNSDIPKFLDDGVFVWDALGFRFSRPAPLNLLEDSALRDKNQWIVLAAVLERAKMGNFAALPLLIDCLRKADDWVMARACAELLGLAGSPACLRQVIEEFDQELSDEEYLDLQIDLSYTFSLSGLLWLVPIMADIYLKTEDRRDSRIMAVLLSHLIEDEFGPVAHATLDDSEYRTLVNNKYEELREEFTTDKVPVLYGEVFSVKKLALRLYHNLKAEDRSNVVIARERQRFEASTGIDCSRFYEQRRLQPLCAIAIVEEFLESPDFSKYEDGVRYFFGHRLPDGL